ncbi:hypothetical protein CONPUDRAFT_160035 [Coniophora puteana RWD-64-598 SS2]|uniref:Potassium channel domain-containing protein n=1 Tax=Coniophora puteana (strain RWD-64-598) TaxID=741705 RepID=R7SF11_CONPW|nr:uncharacterized protein CONPUDRAFT_160035 [Coniophora puteana RWD-64-598 SS2]EIW74327.1 hypothetical protein CONPUDRAFT_160035 [Coniophora puteana RWD-64-598 SS2]
MPSLPAIIPGLWLSFNLGTNRSDLERGIRRRDYLYDDDDGDDHADPPPIREKTSPTAGPTADRTLTASPTQDETAKTQKSRRAKRSQTAGSRIDAYTPSWVARLKDFLFPSLTAQDVETYAPYYRLSPIISGVLIPFSILLEIPGVTERWYITTDDGHIVDTKPNPAILDVGLALSMACAVAANVTLVFRFLEKRVRTATIFCVIFLSTHDIINIIAVTVFGVEHRFDDGYTYGQSFWMTVCSTAVSTLTNISLIADLIRIKDFDKHGSGLTRKQRSLVILNIVLFSYLALGSLIIVFLMELSFVNALFFAVVSIETVGFGDITPQTTGARIFTCLYSAFGIINVAVVVGLFRETVLEGLEVGYQRRLNGLRARRRQGQVRKRAQARWREAVAWRLRNQGSRVWVRDEHEGRPRRAPVMRVRDQLVAWWYALPNVRDADGANHANGRRLNLEALEQSKLEGAAMEAGMPLDMLLPPEFYERQREKEREQERVRELEGETQSVAGMLDGGGDNALHATETPNGHDHAQNPTWNMLNPAYQQNARQAPVSLTGRRIGTMAGMLTRLGLAVFEMGGPVHDGAAGDELREVEGDDEEGGDASAPDPSEDLFGGATSDSASTDDLGAEYHRVVIETETKAFYTRSTVAWTVFILFWTVGSAIFMATEGWSYGISFYFCFIAFTTIGYGDYAPTTTTGRSIFIVWAMLGIGTMTILISIVSDAYSSQYKHMLKSRAFDKAVSRYRKRTKEDFDERVQELTAARVAPSIRFHPHTSDPTLLRARASAQAIGQDSSSTTVDSASEVSSATATATASPSPSGSGSGSASVSIPGSLNEAEEQTYADSMERLRHTQGPIAPFSASLAPAHERALEHAQRALEALPHAVLAEARAFQKYVRYVGDGGEGSEDVAPGAVERDEGVEERLRVMLDEVMGDAQGQRSKGGFGGARTKADILRDPEARKTLFTLSVERSLKELMNIAEHAVAALSERDRLTGMIEHERQLTQEGEHSPRRTASRSGSGPAAGSGVATDGLRTDENLDSKTTNNYTSNADPSPSS